MSKVKRFRLKSRSAPVIGRVSASNFGSIREDIVLVDEEDAHFLRSYRWHVRSNSGTNNHYVVTCIGGQAHTLGRVILGLAVYGKSQRSATQVRYRNGDTFDNRRCNLVVYTPGCEVEAIEDAA